MEKLKNIFETLFSLVLPKDPETVRLEEMSEEEILGNIAQANEMPDTQYKALFQYKNTLSRKAVWEIKYRGNKKVAAKFSKLLYEYILEELSDEMTFSDFQNPLLVPIPVSTKTKRMRGFNQSEFIAKEILKIDEGENFILDLSALKKIKETAHQSKLKNKSERLKNLKGCFLADTEKIKGRNIILVDDVITTGTTMREATKTLRAAGAKKVIGFSIAH